jgi:hypothetical protein
MSVSVAELLNKYQAVVGATASADAAPLAKTMLAWLK